jgi:hypothetical protein
VIAQFDVSPASFIEPNLLERASTIAADNLALTDEAMGTTFLGPEGLLLWLRASANHSRAFTWRDHVRFAEIVEFRDGKVARMRAFHDVRELLRETGLTSSAESARTETYTWPKVPSSSG